MGRHAESPGVQEQAAMALCNIATDPENRGKVGAQVANAHEYICVLPDKKCRNWQSQTHTRARAHTHTHTQGGIEALVAAMGCQEALWAAEGRHAESPGVLEAVAGALFQSVMDDMHMDAEQTVKAFEALSMLTAEQMLLFARVHQLHAVEDWSGIVALEREALALAQDFMLRVQVGGANPRFAGSIHGTLGCGFYNVGQYARALELHAECKAISEALGDRTGVAKACANLAACKLREEKERKEMELAELRRLQEEEQARQRDEEKTRAAQERVKDQKGLHLNTLTPESNAADDQGGSVQLHSLRQAPSVGARVQLHSLRQKPEHNGAEGEVLEFDASAGRWKVQLHPDGLVLALKASNLAVVARTQRTPAAVEEAVVATRLQAALAAVKSEASLETINKLVRNCVQNPVLNGDKFRKIRLTNEKIAAVMAVEGAKTAMLTMGWVENEEFLVLPAGVRLSMKEVRDIEDAKIKLQLQKEPPGQSTVLSTSTPTELMCGADVVIHSLVRSPELNGVRGKIVEPQDPASRRWGVKIDSDGRVIALKPDNLSMTAPARSRRPAHDPEVERMIRAGYTAQHGRLWTWLGELHAARDWPAIVALESEELALARVLREANPIIAGQSKGCHMAGAIYGILGLAFKGVGQNKRAIELFAESTALSETLAVSSGLTAEHNRVEPALRLLIRLEELQAARDWLAIVALECEALTVAQDVRGANPGLAGMIHGVIGLGFYKVGQYARALELHAEHKAMAEALGDRAGVAKACGNLGLCYESKGKYGEALELHAERKAIAEALGDRAGVATACANLGNCYLRIGQYSLALDMHAKHRAIAEELGDRAGVAKACGGLGNYYLSTEDYARALELFTECKAILEELGDRVGVAEACFSLACCYIRTKQHARALGPLLEYKVMAEALGDRAGVAKACNSLGLCYLFSGEYARAIELHAEALAIANEVGDRTGEGTAANNLGAGLEGTGDLSAAARALVQGLAAFQCVERDVGTHDDRRVSVFEQQQVTYMMLQGVLMELEQPGWALGVAAQAKGRALC